MPLNKLTNLFVTSSSKNSVHGPHIFWSHLKNPYRIPKITMEWLIITGLDGCARFAHQPYIITHCSHPSFSSLLLSCPAVCSLTFMPWHTLFSSLEIKVMFSRSRDEGADSYDLLRKKWQRDRVGVKTKGWCALSRSPGKFSSVSCTTEIVLIWGRWPGIPTLINHWDQMFV